MRLVARAVFWMITLVASLASAQAPAREEGRLSRSQISDLTAKAKGGDPKAQAALAKAYQDGNGVTRDEALAVQWYRRAADQGDSEAENSLGVMYQMGRGVPQDKEEAVRWYVQGARHGNAKAMYNLGACYYNGDGVGADDVKSYAWFLLAKQAGDPAADGALHRAETDQPRVWPVQGEARIAQMYETGDELPRDADAALKWYGMAADAGDLEAGLKVATLLLSPGRNPTAQEYSEARERCEKASERHSGGAYCVALIYRDGLGVPKDPGQAARWFERAAERGHARAALQLGEAYWKGVGVKQDLVTAYMWVWLALNSKVDGAEQDEKALHQDMIEKQIEQAKRKAVEWSRQHHIFGLRYRPAEGASTVH